MSVQAVQGQRLWELLNEWAEGNSAANEQSQKTIQGKREQIRRYFRTIDGREHTAVTCNWYIQQGKKFGTHPDVSKRKPWKRSTEITEVSFLRTFTTWLAAYGHITFNFAGQIIKLQAVKKLRPRISMDNEIEVIEAANEIFPSDKSNVVRRKQERLFSLRLIVMCFIRISEIMTVKGEDLHLDVAEPWMKVVRKGGREEYVPLPRNNQEIMAELRKRTKLEWAFMLGYERENATDCLSKSWKHGLKLLGLDERVTPHSVRHTAITEMGDNGASLIALQHLAGHTSSKTTSDIYYQESVHEKLTTQEIFNPLWRRDAPPERMIDFIETQIAKSGVLTDRRFRITRNDRPNGKFIFKVEWT